MYWSFKNVSGTTETRIGNWKSKNMMRCSIYGYGFRKCVCSLKGWQKTSPELYNWIRAIVQWLYLLPHANPTSPTPQKHVKTAPFCFGGPRSGKIGFGDPGPENMVQRLRTKSSRYTNEPLLSDWYRREAYLVCQVTWSPVAGLGMSSLSSLEYL